MTNEQLIRQYYDGDETALEKLYHKNLGLIRGIAKETADQTDVFMIQFFQRSLVTVIILAN